MNAPKYRHPPIMQAYAGHAVGTAFLGFLLPSGDNLGWLHKLIIPIVDLIPNAVRITNRASDPAFAQTFIGLSLLIAFFVLLYFCLFVRGYHTRTFEGVWKRRIVLLYVWSIVLFGLGVFWLVPYLDPLSKGRSYFLLLAAISSRTGVLTVMNQLVVGFPLALLLTLWLGHTCTTVRNHIKIFNHSGGN